MTILRIVSSLLVNHSTFPACCKNIINYLSVKALMAKYHWIFYNDKKCAVKLAVPNSQPTYCDIHFPFSSPTSLHTYFSIEC